MSEVGAPDRARLLRSKRELRDGIVTSRKRKLREFFAVCDTTDPIPNVTFESIDAPPTNDAEASFLDVCDILQDRLFDESNLPPRRFLRSDTLKSASPNRKVSNDAKTNDTSRKAAKLQRDGSRTRKSRATTPSSRSDAGQSVVEDSSTQGLPMQRSTSKGSQTDLPAESATVLDEIVEETFENATQPEPESSTSNDVVPPSALETDKVARLESAPNSPGVDPRKAMPISAEDAAELDEPLVEGLGTHDGEPHKALTAHLPPKEVQEQHLKEIEKAREQKEQLSIKPPPQDGRLAEPLSSPGSTIGAHSATTPALHETSTDTSPENEAQYDPGQMDKDDDVQTPPELRKTAEEEAEQAEHDRLHQAQIDIAQAEILGSTPAAVGVEPTVEDKQTDPEVNDSQAEDSDVPEQVAEDALTKEASEVVEEVVEDQTQKDDAAHDEPMTGVDELGSDPKPSAIQQGEVADSEAEEQTPPVDAMDVDTPTVQDSFESSAPIERAEDITPISPHSTEPAPKQSEKPSATPSVSSPRKAPTPAPAPSSDRRQTRVATGAMRHKSVSEILGEIPRPNTTSSDRNATKGDSDSAATSNSISRSATPQSPSGRMRTLVEKAKDKERSKLSTVVFAKKPARHTSNNNALMPSGSQLARDAKNDYFTPLFLATSSTSTRGVPSLDALLATAHKTITTENAYVPINENQTAKILKRIYSLQTMGKWSLRQPKRADEPQRQSSHWDVLLREAKWMRTDFREEGKWKRAVARNLASACAEWYEASPEDRKLLQVKATSPVVGGSKDVEMGEASDLVTPDLVTSGEFDSPIDEFDEEPRLNLLETVAPTDIFGLQDDDVVFGLRPSPATDKLLKELPMYSAPLTVPATDPSKNDLDPDRYWRREALPLSKYVEGRMELKSEGPPRKKSRYDYNDESDDEDQVVFGEEHKSRDILPPESSDVALFNPDHKHIRDRIHAGHQFRPPSEYPMPLQSFFESRVPSQWTLAEDDTLRTHVRDYSYNWSLISNLLTSPSMFSSGAERRTPWECFERWICLEGLPADMQKTHYFRAYNNRVENANRAVLALAAQQPQQPNAQGQIQPRRRTTASIRVDRRRQQKYLHMVDAMRKLAKKRESSLQKQQQAAGIAATRKQNEPPAARTIGRTPQEFSKLKFEQGERMKEQYALLQQRQIAQQRAAIQARMQNTNGQQPALQNGQPQPRPLTANGTQVNGAPATGQNLTVPGQNRARGPMPLPGQGPMQNGLRAPQPLMNGVPQAPMQGIQGQLPNPALDVGLVTQAHRISEQQRQAIQLRQQGQMPGNGQNQNSPPRTLNGMPPSTMNGMSPATMTGASSATMMGQSPATMNGMSPPGFAQMQNANMMPFPNPNGLSSPVGGPSTQAGSPRMSQPTQLSAQMMPQAQRLEETLRQKYPNATTEQIIGMVTEHLKSLRQQHQQRPTGLAQSAMNAAAGGNMGMMNGMGMNGMNATNPRMPTGVESSSPQMYAQMLRQQQENQQKASQAAAAANNANGNGQANGQGHQRSGSANSGK